MPDGKINLEDVLGPRSTLSVAAEETDAERDHRHFLERKAAWHEHLKSSVLFFVVIVAILAISCLCVFEMLFDEAASPETKRWAQTTLSALFAGSFSFLLGQATARKAK